MLEFPRWLEARAWGYLGNFAVVEGMESHGVECVVLPALAGMASDDPDSWLSHARALLDGERFDQVWVWLVHCDFDPRFLRWLRSLAPVVVGWTGESLEHTEAEVQLMPRLARRSQRVLRQLEHVTHALAVDERDAEILENRGISAIWLPMAVPARTIREPREPAVGDCAAVYGSLYGERGEWLRRGLRAGFLQRPEPPEDALSLPERFDEVHELGRRYLSSSSSVERAGLEEYVAAWRSVRAAIHDCWMRSLSQCLAVVNLPSIGKVYTSRVVETMAAGRPAISWRVPDRPRNLALFEENREILLYDAAHPEGLELQVRSLASEPERAGRLVTRARHAIWRKHTVEERVRQVFDWIATGRKPDYRHGSVGRNLDRHLASFRERALGVADPGRAEPAAAEWRCIQRRRLRGLINAAAHRGDGEAEVDHLSDAVRHYPDDREFRVRLRSLLLERGVPGEAQLIYDRLLRVHAGDEALRRDAAALRDAEP